MTRSDAEELRRRAECQREYRRRLKEKKRETTPEEKQRNKEVMQGKRLNVEFREKENLKQWKKRWIGRVVRDVHKIQVEEKWRHYKRQKLTRAMDLAEIEKQRREGPVVDIRIRERIRLTLREINLQILEMESQIKRGYLKEIDGSKEYASIVALYEELSVKPTYWS